MIDRVGQSFNLQDPDASGASSPADPVGQLRGESVMREKSIESLVQDSFEEASFSVAAQDESVDVEEVEVEDLSTVIADRIKKITQLKDQIAGARGGLDPAKLRQLLAALRAQDPAAVDAILNEVGERFGDPTDQYAALDAMLQELGRRQGDRELKKALKKASDTLWDRHARAIIAGLHASPVAERFAHGDVDQFQALREAYRAQVLEQPTMLQSLKNLRERFGDDRLEGQIKFLVAAAGRDLDALVSSVEKEQLEHTVSDLARLQLISSMRSQAATIVTRMAKRFSPTRGKGDWDLLQDSMELMEDKWTGAQKVEALSSALSAHEIEGQIYFVRELNAFFHDLPLKAYDDPDSRERVLQASQEALDHLIEREEEEL
jgi:type III secretion protein W